MPANPVICVLFDLDGTLVDSSAFEDRLYRAAIIDVMGDVSIHNDWSGYEHVTHAGILLEICRDNGVKIDKHEQQVRTRFGELVAEYLMDGGTCPATPGAKRLVADLQRAPSFEIGIATGSWGHTARMKLKHSGLRLSSAPVTSSDNHYQRTAIMQHCSSMMPGNGETVYVGDAEWDLKASETLGWKFIGVGTRLKNKCKHWVPDLSDLGLSDIA